MKRFNSLALVVGAGLAFGATSVRADVPFSFTATGGNIPAIPQQVPVLDTTTGVSFFPLIMSPTLPGPISSLELALNGLSHTNPEDLEIYLISPFGAFTTVMTDRGDGNDLVNTSLVFNDFSSPLPAVGVPLTPGGHYMTEEGSGPGLGFNKYVGTLGGTDAWILVVIDDASGDSGSLGSFTLRGTAVPEPVSLSLLALGALTALHRHRRRS